jgi:broad specificity phosphatase PhoE
MANVAFPRADASGSEETGLAGPDSSVELTALGQEQSTALGKWLSAQPLDAVISSPYLRTRETTRIALAEIPADRRPVVRLDERLRDRELGILEMLTRAAINRRYPDEQRRRSWTGDFAYRPPGGESMADVLLRVRGFLADAQVRYPGQRVLVVAHDATIAMLRFAIEDLSEVDSYPLPPIGNATVTRWVRTGDHLELAEYNTTVS